MQSKTQLSCHLSSVCVYKVCKACGVSFWTLVYVCVFECKRMRSGYARDNPPKAVLFRPKSLDITLPISDFNWLSHITQTPA